MEISKSKCKLFAMYKQDNKLWVYLYTNTFCIKINIIKTEDNLYLASWYQISNSGKNLYNMFKGRGEILHGGYLNINTTIKSILLKADNVEKNMLERLILGEYILTRGNFYCNINKILNKL